MLSSFAGGMMGAFAGSMLFSWLMGSGRPIESGDLIYGATGAAAGIGTTWLLKNRGVLLYKLLQRNFKQQTQIIQPQFKSPSTRAYLLGAGLGTFGGIIYNGKKVHQREIQ
jgi:hypothetical protein